MTTCSKCGAVCREKKDEGRFQRRHPAKCESHERLQQELSSDTKSVDYDEANATAAEETASL
jgi:hypothetical protein